MPKYHSTQPFLTPSITPSSSKLTRKSMKYLTKKITLTLIDVIKRDLSHDVFYNTGNFEVIIFDLLTKDKIHELSHKRAVIFFSATFNHEMEEKIMLINFVKKNTPIYNVNIFCENHAIMGFFKEISLSKMVSAFPVKDMSSIGSSSFASMSQKEWNCLTEYANKVFMKIWNKKLLSLRS
jgi:hypothetical protein